MNEMRTYISKSPADRLIMVAVALVFGVASLAFKAQGNKIMMIFSFLLAAFLLIAALTSGMQDRRALAALEEEGLLEQAEADFETAVECASGYLRLGRKFVFRKKNCQILTYDEIRQLAYAERMGEDRSIECNLYVKLDHGLDQPLCPLYGSDTRQQAQAIMDYCCKINPDIACISDSL